SRDLVHGLVERGLVRLRRLRESRQLPDELNRRRADFLFRRRRVEVEQGANVSAHTLLGYLADKAGSREPAPYGFGGAAAGLSKGFSFTGRRRASPHST